MKSVEQQGLKMIQSIFDIQTYIEKQSQRADKILKEILSPKVEYSKILFDSMRYSLFAGGKRLRPVLVIAAYEAFSNTNDSMLPIACATEMIHCYSLIHDDLPCMDDDDLRRGLPTNHKVYGEGMAVLSGDGLQALAFQIIAEATGFEAEIKNQLVLELSRASGAYGMVGGQAEDLVNETKQVNATQLEFIHMHKTAALIAASVVMGVIASGQNVSVQNIFRDFGHKIGLAFQIIDDVLDEEATSAQLGKSAGKDAIQKKMTYPSLLGLTESKQKARMLIEEALSLIQNFGEKVWPLQALAQFILSRQH